MWSGLALIGSLVAAGGAARLTYEVLNGFGFAWTPFLALVGGLAVMISARLIGAHRRLARARKLIVRGTDRSAPPPAGGPPPADRTGG